MEVTPPKYDPQAKSARHRISISYIIDAFLQSIERFPITLCYFMAFIFWGVIDCWSFDLFYKSTQTVQNLQAALWFLTGNGIFLTLAVYLWCEQTCKQHLCNKIQIVANLLLLSDFVNIILNFNSFSNSVWVGRLAVETALLVSIIFVRL